jgi:hypothetical protein
MKKLILISLLAFLLVLPLVSAHQPRLEMNIKNSEQSPILIEDPEISKAYYGELKGNPDYYKIVSDKPFSLYVNILVPDIAVENLTRLSVEVKGASNNVIIFLNGTNSTWKEFYEPFGNDNYLKGPEARVNVSAGSYQIKVFNSENVGKYSLAIGEIEEFPAIEIIKSLYSVPLLQVQFFNKPVYEAFNNIAGLPILVILIVVIVLMYLLYKLSKRKRKKEEKFS